MLDHWFFASINVSVYVLIILLLLYSPKVEAARYQKFTLSQLMITLAFGLAGVWFLIVGFSYSLQGLLKTLIELWG